MSFNAIRYLNKLELDKKTHKRLEEYINSDRFEIDIEFQINRPEWELKNTRHALTSLPWLNEIDEWELLLAVEYALKTK